jgi:hypothetical protein
MRIISKFHDYYDGVRAYGEDRTVIFKRNNESIEEKLDIKMVRREIGVYDLYPLILFFCGKQYNFYMWEISNQFKTGYIYKYDDPLLKKMLTTKKRNRSFADVVYGKLTEDYFKVKEIGPDIFFKYNAAYFLYNGKEIEIYPVLKELKFWKVLDSFSAFQEIDQFISGVLTKTEEIKPIEDKYLIKQKGFDKWSFRKKGIRSK